MSVLHKPELLLLVYIMIYVCDFFFFSSRRRHTRLVSDWSSDVCSSDLGAFDKFAEKAKGKRGTATVDAAFLQEIEAWREQLRSEERRVGKECRSGWST